jgi:hypothetical protein
MHTMLKAITGQLALLVGQTRPKENSETRAAHTNQSLPSLGQTHRVTIHNSFDPLTVLDDSCDKSSENSDIAEDEPTSDTDVSPPPNQEAWHQARKQRRRKKTLMANHGRKTSFKTTVLTDSVLRNIDVSRIEALSSDANCQVKFIHEAGDIGSTVDFIQGPSISRGDPLIIHTGTNHVEKEGVNVTLRRLDRLEYNILHEQYASVALSSVVYRRTDSRYVRDKITTINTTLLDMCSKNGWTYIDNGNLDESCLEQGDCVHLNRYGNERIAHNLASAIKQLVLKPRFYH